jgi:hypothetical protein
MLESRNVFLTASTKPFKDLKRREKEILLNKATETAIPEKPRLLLQLKKGKFNIPDFIYVSASDFKNERFDDLKAFLDRHRESFKVITRSAHPHEEFFKGGTFDSDSICANQNHKSGENCQTADH